MSGLALKRDMGQASTRLREEETYAPRQVETRKQMVDSDIANLMRQDGDREQQLLKQQMFEKYAPNKPKGSTEDQQAAGDFEEATAVLRFG